MRYSRHLLPLALVLLTVAGLGSYYETNDDLTLDWLFRGTLAAAPVTRVPLYFHGIGRAVAAATAAWPGVAWLGWAMGTLLLLATLVFFAEVDALLRPRLGAGARAAVLAAFFGVGWLEHWLWFSHGRVALLLAGTAGLEAARRGARGRRLGLGAVAVAWAIRPGLAVLGVLAVVPLLWRAAGGRRAAALLGGAAAVLLLLAGVLAATQSPAAARTRATDGYLTRILDYEQLAPAPRTATDRHAVAATQSWLLGDSALVNPTRLPQAYHWEPAAYFGHTVPRRLTQRLGLLARDYFPLLVLLAGSWLVARSQPVAAGFGWAQAWYGGLLLGLAAFLKLPPRVALPLLDYWLLANLFWLMPLPGPAAPVPLRRGQRWALAGAAVLVLALYGAKTAHRSTVLRGEQQRHAAAWAAIARHHAAQPGAARVLAGANDLLKSLSPFRAYSPGPGPVLLLTGWVAHDPSQARLRRRLSGAADQSTALRRLAARPSTQWLLSAETAHWLNAGPYGLALRRGPVLAQDTALAWYGR